MAGSAKRLDVDEPLIGEQRLENGIAAIAARHGELVRFDALDEPELAQIGQISGRALRSGRGRGRRRAPAH